MQDTSRFIKLSAKHYTMITFFEKSDNMALIKCPECGFGIKEYFDNMRYCRHLSVDKYKGELS